MTSARPASSRLAELRQPLWPVEERRWLQIIERACSFADAWERKAVAEGWSLLELYGLHRSAPGYNLAAMGAAWLIARGQDTVLAVSEARILVQRPTGNGLAIYRPPRDLDAELAWVLARAGGSKASGPSTAPGGPPPGVALW